MVLKHQLDKVTALAASAVHVPTAVAGTAIGLTKGTVRAVRSVIAGHHEAAPPAPTDVEPAEPRTVSVDPTEPVNVTEELGLDPWPVAQPKRRPARPERPLTGIDANADPDHVDATPADVAKVIGEE